MKQANYHTHTWRCNHATGSDEVFVIEAMNNGFETLGFSDHACWKYNSNFKPRIRMELKEFKGYKDSILKLKNQYKNHIDIQFGMEAEYFPEYMDWLLDFCVEEEIDYLIFGNHYYLSDETYVYFGHTEPENIHLYFEECIKGLKTGMYSYLAHPELIMRNQYIGWNQTVEEGFHKICQTCKELDIPLEYNVLGMQYNDSQNCECYPNDRFWNIASQYKNKAIIGMDAHQPSDLSRDLYEKALENLSKYDVEIVSEIPKVDFLQLQKKRDEESKNSIDF